MIFSLREMIDIAIMSAFLGYIFSDFLARFNLPKKDDVHSLMSHYRRGFNFEHFKFALYVTAPAVILHEFGHLFKYRGHYYDHPGCVMRPAPGLKYREWVEELIKYGPCRKHHDLRWKDYFMRHE